MPENEKILLTNGGQIKLESYKKGIHRIMKPLLRRSLITPSVEIYQPIVPINAYRQYPEYYNSEYNIWGMINPVNFLLDKEIICF